MDSTPQNVIVKAGERRPLNFRTEKLASIRIKKIDAVTKKGIYGVRFLVKDEANNLIGEYSTDQDGYIELRDILTDGKSEIKLKVEEIAAAQGYVLDSTDSHTAYSAEAKRPNWSWKIRLFSDKFRW